MSNGFDSPVSDSFRDLLHMVAQETGYDVSIARFRTPSGTVFG